VLVSWDVITLPTTEIIVLVFTVVNDALPPAKRPVPPVPVKTPVLVGLDGAPVITKVENSWSPFAHTVGNAYYYAHMSTTNGGNRRVGQGEHIGYVGQTGNATGPHLHFEIRLGGVNGQRVNPFNTLINAGC
jgi:murein DD-endopeptidase MepM/ murein hydrolase activator NlpD